MMSGSGTGGNVFSNYGTTTNSYGYSGANNSLTPLVTLNRNVVPNQQQQQQQPPPPSEHLVNEIKHEILDDKYNKSLLQQRALNQDTRGSWFLYILAATMASLLIVLLGAFVFAAHSTPPPKPSVLLASSSPPTTVPCGWGTYSDDNGICAPNESVLFDWYAIRKSRNSGVCVAPKLSEWICLRYQSETNNAPAVSSEKNPYERYLTQYADQWARKAIDTDPMLSLAKKFACAGGTGFSELQSLLRSKALDNTTSISKWMGYAVAFGVAPIVMGTAPDPRINRTRSTLLVIQLSSSTNAKKQDIVELHATGALDRQIMDFARARKLLREKLGLSSWEDFWSGIQDALSMFTDGYGINEQNYLGYDIWIRDIDDDTLKSFTKDQLLALSSLSREPVQIPSRTQALLGTPDEYFTSYRNKDTSKRCVQRVQTDFYRVYSHLLASELEAVGRVLDSRSSGHRQLYKLFTELIDSLKQTVQESKSISSECRRRVLEKASRMKLEISASTMRPPAFKLPFNSSYDDLLLSMRAINLAESLVWYFEEENTNSTTIPGKTPHVVIQNTLEPAMYYDRLRNAIVVHPFMLSELLYPFHPFDSASMLNVYTRLGWRIAREMYWAFDLQIGASHDSNGSVSPHWLYPAASDLERIALIRQEKKPECLATRFAFCLTLRALSTHADRDPFSATLQRNTSNIEWLERAFWIVSMTYACAGTDPSGSIQDFDKCLHVFPPYRATFDCTATTGKRKLYQALCGKESVSSSAWCSCMPFD